MNYPHILAKVWREHWCITLAKHYAIATVLESRLGGQTVQMPNGDPAPERPSRYDVGDIAVIPIFGILGKHLDSIEMMCGGCSLDSLSSMLSVADGSSRITKIILDIHSPGGTVTGTPEVAAQIADIATRKPVVAFTDSECCSGALYLASQATHFYATESAEVGSVGVRMILLDETKALEMEGLKVNPIFSGKFKLSGASFKPLTDEEREMFQADSDRIFEQFKAAVISKRPVPDEFLQGQIFRGVQAMDAGFLSGVIDSFEEALALTAQLSSRAQQIAA